MSNIKSAERIILNVRNSVVFGEGDLGEAIQNAIGGVFPFASDERKAELYATLVEGWEANADGIIRKLWLSDTLYAWNQRHLFGGEVTIEPL